MCSKSFSAAVVTFLTTLGLLPRGKSKFLDRLGVLVWVVIVVGLACAWLYVSREQTELRMNVLTIDNLMVLVTTMLVYPLNSVGTVLALASAGPQYPWIQSKHIPLPDCPVLFLFVVISFIWVFIANIISDHLLMFPTTFDKFIAVAEWNFSFTLTLISSFSIGICVAQFNKSNVQMGQTYTVAETIYYAEKNVAAFKALKCFVSPIMLVFFVVNSLIFVGYTYMTLSFKQWDAVPKFFPVYFFPVMSMVYVCVVIERCYGNFTSITDMLRLHFIEICKDL